MTALIYSYDLDERRTAKIPAASQTEADAKLNAYFDSTDDAVRSEFEVAYVEYHDTDEEEEEEEEEREGMAELVRAILYDNSGSSHMN